MEQWKEVRIFRLIPIWALLFGALAMPCRAAPPPRVTPKVDVLTVKHAFKKALENSRVIKLARVALKNAELQYKDAWETMFLPSVGLTLAVGSKYTLGQIKNEAAKTSFAGSYEQGYPSTTATLSLGSYTLFDGWKQWIQYERERINHEKAREVYLEAERDLKNLMVEKLFRLKVAQEKLDAANRSVEISDAVAALVRSRVRVGKAAPNDVVSANGDLISAKKELTQKNTDALNALWDLDQVLGDPLGTQYRVQDTIKYAPIAMSAEDAYQTFLTYSATMKAAKFSIKDAEYALEAAEKARLPLPKVDFSGVQVQWSNAYYGAKAGEAGTIDTNPNWNVSGTISITFPIFGPGGFFQGRTVERARLTLESAETTHADAITRGRVDVFNLIQSIKQQEEAVELSRQQYTQSQQLLDSTFSKLSESSVNRLELRDAINTARSTEFSLREAELAHLSAKQSLAKLIGLEYLPGEKFE